MLSTSASCFYLSENHLTQEKVDAHLVDGLMDGMNVHVMHVMHGQPSSKMFQPLPACVLHAQQRGHPNCLFNILMGL
jgi:hypothetical protein